MNSLATWVGEGSTDPTVTIITVVFDGGSETPVLAGHGGISVPRVKFQAASRSKIDGRLSLRKLAPALPLYS